MSFLSNLISRETRRAVNKVVDQAVDKGINQLQKNIFGNDNTSSATTHSNGTSQQGYASPQPNGKVNNDQAELALRNSIQKIFMRDWSTKGYELRTDIPASELNAGDGARNYSYGFYLNGEPKCLIMVLTNRNHYKLKAVRLSEQAARNAGATYLNFFTHLPNREDYIAERFQNEIR
ncbi:MAG: hypothetical protein ACI4DO_01230 [Roseburia sp.]